MTKHVFSVLFFSVIILLALPLSASVYDYTFTQATGTYAEITGGVLLGSESSDDEIFADPAVPAGGYTYSGPGYPIGFNFSFNDVSFDVIGISANGWISFGQSSLGNAAVNLNATSQYSPISSNVAITPAQLGNRVTGFARDLQAQPAATLRLQTIGSAPNRVCVIQWKNYKRFDITGVGDSIRYQIRLYETTNKVAFHYGNIIHGPATSFIHPQVGLRGPEITDFFNRTTETSWSATTAGTGYASTCAFTPTCIPASGLIFEFNPPPTYPNDLQALSLSGPTGPANGSPANYTFTVRNRGTAAQSNYTLRLMSGTTLLTSVPGPAIQPGQVIPVVVSHTFTTQGPITVFGRINFATDQNLANNDTNALDLVVQPAGTMLAVIGTGTSTQRQPFGIYYDYERDAALYTAAEIGAHSSITALKWYVGVAYPYSVPYKIYLKATNDTSLGLAPWATMITGATLMLDAAYSFNQAGWVTFNFPTPFSYTDGNLLVLVETNAGNWQSDYATFRYHTASAGHHVSWYQDDSPPTGNGTLNNNRPNIGVLLDVSGRGHLFGTVTSGTTSLAGATITVNNTIYTATSSVTGAYNVQYLPQGNYTVTCSKLGYVTQTLPVTINANQIATLNFNLTASPIVNVTGTVVGSDAQTVGLVDAEVTLSGTLNYSAVTNAQGAFTISGVTGNETYSYTITRTGYTDAAGTINVGTADYNMGTVILNEFPYPATNVQAVEALPNVNLTWTEPNPNIQNFEDSFESYTDFAIDFPPWTCLDLDQSATYGSQQFSFPGEYGTMAFMVFNPLTTTPPSTALMGTAHSGNKMATCWDASSTSNNDWLISPQISIPDNGVVKFWARSQTAEYGLERFHVGVSNTGTAPADFTIISGAAYVQAPVTWTEYTYQLNSYAGQNVRIGIRCVSNDAFVFMVDDFFVGVPGRDLEARVYNAFEPAGSHNIRNTGTYVSSKTAERSPVSSEPHTHNYRTVGYKVWRLQEGQESNEAGWTLLTPTVITATAYQDAGWSTVPDGNYKWAVKAVYTNNVLSASAFSNMIPKLTQSGTISGLVRNSGNSPIAGASVTAGTYTATTNVTGAYNLQVPAGTYTVTCSAVGYNAGTQAGIVVVTGQATTVNFVLTAADLFTDGFETYSDFALDFPPWVNVDVDQSTTQTITGTSFPHSGEAMSFIVFNPGATIPPLTDAASAAHGGSRYAACFAATTPPNNDWLISQPLNIYVPGSVISFWAKSVTADYGLERFKVGISTGATHPGTFTIISGASYVQAPVNWTPFTYTIPAFYVGSSVRIGIQCVSDDAFIFMVDDFVFDFPVSNDDPITPVFATALNGNFPNPFNPETTIRYSVKGTSPVTVEIYNTKGQRVKTLVSETKAEGHYQAKWDGKDDNGQKVTGGVYFYRMKSGNYSSSKKMILLK